LKLIIQIPCYNEEQTLRIALEALPREVPGIDLVEWLIIDDGSSDRTVEVARECGVDYIVRFPTNQGLAKGFMAGLNAGLAAGADIIVNTDADNQYQADDIPELIRPILEGKAEIVIGARPIDKTEHWSPIKKALQHLGSWTVRKFSGTETADAPSGFRAISRDAAMRLNVFNRYTYTLETIIQAGVKGIPIVNVPVRTNGDLRPSRLVKSIRSYVQRSMVTILRIWFLYNPATLFLYAGMVPFTLGGLWFVWWLIRFLFIEPEKAGAPGLIAAGTLVIIAVQLWVVGLLADLMSTNRVLLEDVQYRLKKVQFDSGVQIDGVPMPLGELAWQKREDAGKGEVPKSSTAMVDTAEASADAPEGETS